MKYGSNKNHQSYSGKCDVRLTHEENRMLNELSYYNSATRSQIMRKALRDFYRFNTEKEYTHANESSDA